MAGTPRRKTLPAVMGVSGKMLVVLNQTNFLFYVIVDVLRSYSRCHFYVKGCKMIHGQTGLFLMEVLKGLTECLTLVAWLDIFT